MFRKWEENLQGFCCFVCEGRDENYTERLAFTKLIANKHIHYFKITFKTILVKISSGPGEKLKGYQNIDTV